MKKAAVFIFLLAVAGVYAQVPSAGLVAYYPLSASANDNSDNANNGAIKGGVIPVEDRFGVVAGALRFNGKDGYISIPNSPALQKLTASVTVALWMKAEKGPGASNDIRLPLISKSGTDNPAGSKAQFRLWLTRNFGDSKSSISVSSDFTMTDNNYNAHPVQFDKWHFVAFTLEEGFVYFYFDGKLVSQAPNSKPFTANDLALEIGRDATAGSNYFTGCIDDLRIYRYALSLSEIQSLYLDVPSTPPTPEVKDEVTWAMPKNIQAETDKGKCTAVVTFAEPVISGGSLQLKQVKGFPSGSAFDVGRHLIVYEGTAVGGKKIVDSFNITVSDKELPVFACNPDISSKAAPNTKATKVSFEHPAVTDNCPNIKIEILSALPPGAEFPVGVSEVRYRATDASGNKSECSFKVSVAQDVIAPVRHCVPDLVVFTKPDKRTVKVSYHEPYIDAAGVKVPMKRTKGPASGSEFPLGKTEMVYEAEDSTTCAFNVTVKDTIAPSVVCPPAITRVCEYGKKTTMVNYSLPKAYDAGNEISVKLIKGQQSGSNFPMGINTITYEAVDEAGNKSICSFDINVTEEVVKPVLRCPGDIVAFTKPTAGKAVVNYEQPYLDIKGSQIAMKRTSGPASGTELGPGKTEVVYEADGQITCRFSITIKDTIAPVFSCPSTVQQFCEYGQKTVAVNYALPKATDGQSEVPVKRIAGFSSGSQFPLGPTSIVYEATDNSGNKSVCAFVVMVTVKEPGKAPESVTVKPVEKKAPEVKPAPVANPDVQTAEKQPEALAKPTSDEIEKAKSTEGKPLTPLQEKMRAAEKVFETETETKHPEEAKPVVPVKAEQIKTVIPVKQEEEPVEPVAAKLDPKPVPVEKPIAEAKAKETIANEPPKAKATEPAKPSKTYKPLSLSCIDDIIKQNDPGKCGAVVSFPTPQVSGGNEPKVIQTKGIESNRFFSIGTTDNAFTAKDASNYLRDCSFSVTIKDREAPVFKCPVDTNVYLPTGRRGVIYYFKEPAVSDNCSVDSMDQVIGSKSGCFLQVGVHPFSYKAIDEAGNYQVCTYSVIVREDTKLVTPEPPKKLDAVTELGNDSIQYEHKAEVRNCQLTVMIYDDGEEDNDTVSIIFNGDVIVSKSMIRLKENGAIIRNLVLNQGDKNYLVAKAWNKGRYGLNTLKVEIYEGNFIDERELKYKKPVIAKVLHSKPGIAGGMLLKCSE